MAVATAHLLGRTPHPLVDHPLVDPLARTVADEAVAQTMPTRQHRPRAVCHCPLEVVDRFVSRDRFPRQAIPATSLDFHLTKEMRPTWMFVTPGAESRVESPRDRDASRA